MTPGYNITAVERDTGLSKDVLRMWERRYGFPVPERDQHGERVYSVEQVERLRQIKRLLDQGHRPGKLLALSPDELSSLAPRKAPATAHDAPPTSLQPLLDMIKSHDAAAYQQAMLQRLARTGLMRFVLDTVAPLTERVGEAWMDGSFEVFEEHLYTEQTKRLLRHAIAGLLTNAGAPRILLTTPPEELHGLGLLMAECLFALEGATCIPLGTQTPQADILLAARAHNADVVALSISSAFPARQIAPLIAQLRALLPVRVELWVGGRAVERQQASPGVRIMPTLQTALDALAAWRAAAAANAG